MQRPRVPPFQPAHLRIEIPLEWVVEVDDAPQMGPAQLCTQCVHNLHVWKHLSESHHVEQVSFREPTAKLAGQLCTQCGHNLLAVARPLLFQNVCPDALADLPVEQHQGGVDALRDRLPRLKN